MAEIFKFIYKIITFLFLFLVATNANDGISLPPHLPILLSPPFFNFSFIFSLQLFSIFFPLPSTFLTFAEAHICLGIVVHEFEEKFMLRKKER
ncbi:hypothetical protein QL285_060847 [Trifolium repens]|nr:hypothetical protein QL285_060847 [Trifolium repens]